MIPIIAVFFSNGLLWITNSRQYYSQNRFCGQRSYGKYLVKPNSLDSFVIGRLRGFNMLMCIVYLWDKDIS